MLATDSVRPGPSVAGALMLGQPGDSADLRPGSAAGAGEADGIGDAWSNVALPVDELLQVVERSKGATWASHSAAAQESSSDSGQLRMPGRPSLAQVGVGELAGRHRADENT